MLALLAWFVTSLVARSVAKGAWIATIGIIAFWTVTPILSVWTKEPSGGWMWVLAAMAAGFLTVRKWDPPTKAINRFALVLLLVSGSFVLIKSIRPSIERGSVVSTKGPSPDIFFLIVDGYGRDDQLQRVMRFDNTPFVTALEERGFLVARKSNSNYCQTALSLASTLNLAWIQELLPNGTTNRGDLSALVDRPRMVQNLRARGYETIAIGTGFPGFTFDGFDLVITEPEAVSYFENTLLAMTPIRLSNRFGDSQYSQKRRSLEHGFAVLQRLGKPTAKPRLVFAHVMAPHPPFVFDAEGRSLQPLGPFGFWDGSDFMTHVGSSDSYREGYVGQLKWLNSKLLETIDKLKVGSIIIIQGDHGSKLGLDQDVLKKTDLKEVFGNLAAYRVPQPVRAKLSEGTTPLNAIRAIMGFVTGTDFPDLPDKSYYSPYSRPTEFVDVTDQVR